MNNKLKLYIVRHGQTEWNVLEKFQGQLNSPLTPEGIKKVKETAKELKDVKFVADKKLVDISYEKALKVLPENRIFKGIIATGDIFVAKKEIKDRIKENFDSLCCEMESCSIVHTCHLNNVGYLALRSISDNANEEADCDFETFVLESAKVVKSIILDIIEEI